MELGDKLILIYSGLEVPGDDSSMGVDVSRRYALSTQLYALSHYFQSNNGFVICILLLLLFMFYKCQKYVM